MTEPLRVAVIGAGTISQLAHLPAAELAENIEIAALCDRRADLLAAVARRYHVTRSYPCLEEALADDAIEAVDLCVPTIAHDVLATQALSAGKHVLCEKPMASTVARARAMVAAAHDSGCRLMIGHHKRYDPGCEQAREALGGGAVGTPRLVTYLFGTGNWTGPAPRQPLRSAQPGAAWEYEYPLGVEQAEHRAYYESLLEMFTHITNLIRWLIGDPTWVLTAQPASSVVRGTLMLGWGADGADTQAFCTDGPHYPADVWNEVLTIWGDEGRLELTLPPNVHVNRPASVRLFSARTGQDALLPPVYGWAFARELGHFAEHVRSRQPFRTEGCDSLRDVIVAETAAQAAATGIAPLRIDYSAAEERP